MTEIQAARRAERRRSVRFEKIEQSHSSEKPACH
jgi:hypothetical protein